MSGRRRSHQHSVKVGLHRNFIGPAVFVPGASATLGESTAVPVPILPVAANCVMEEQRMPDRATVSRRQLLAGLVGAGAAAGLSACGLGSRPAPVGPGAVRAAESARPSNGTVRALSLRARPVQVDFGGTVVHTWAYGDTVPGRPLRATVGDRVRVAFRNDLPEATSVHWHGLAIRNDMDGVPDLTTPNVAPGGELDYDFVVPDPGTHWLHPHTGLQTDRGLYAPFIVDDPDEPGGYDAEWVLVLDDWTDGVGRSPEQIFAALKSGSAGSADGGMGGMGGMTMGGTGGMGGMGGGDGDVAYPLFLVNGRAPSDPDVLTGRPGQRVRLRIINAAADTIFHLALGGHRLGVTHADGYPVNPVSTSALRIGMGERYDAVVTLADGVFPLVARPAGKTGTARALVRTSSGSAPGAWYRPRELATAPLTVADLSAGAAAALPRRAPDSVQNLVLSGAMRPYVWTINGSTYDHSRALTVRQGQVARLRIRNMSMMSHPVHLHGHTFQLGPAGGHGPRKDTVLVPPMAAVDVDLAADNPGRWMVHCHNAYHAEAGMMTRLDYLA
jgi:FtsP/CotA-like multicopper oxidase with cupredoxin domain